MARTFVHIELEHAHAESTFSEAMGKLGFVQTVTGKTLRKALRLPIGMYLIERAGVSEALELTQQAARQSNTRVRIFCVQTEDDTRFALLERV